MRRFSIATIAVAISLTSACGGQSSADRPSAVLPQTGRVVDVSVLRFADSNYFGAPTPAENAKARWSDVVVSGTVEEFALGRSHTIGGGSPLHKVVMKVKVDQQLKGDAKYVADGNAYVEVWGGPKADIDHFNKAIPQGTPVVVFGSDQLTVDSGAKNEGAGHPPGTLVLSGVHPQSLFFEGVPVAAAEGGTTEVTAANGEATVIPGQESLADFGTAWTELDNLAELLEAAKPGLN